MRFVPLAARVVAEKDGTKLTRGPGVQCRSLHGEYIVVEVVAEFERSHLSDRLNRVYPTVLLRLGLESRRSNEIAIACLQFFASVQSIHLLLAALHRRIIADKDQVVGRRSQPLQGAAFSAQWPAGCLVSWARSCSRIATASLPSNRSSLQVGICISRRALTNSIRSLPRIPERTRPRVAALIPCTR
jgi:hypothetical protein